MPISIANAEHYAWGGACDGWYLVKTDRLHIIQERMPPGAAESLHRHAHSRQFFYILSGEATMECDGQLSNLHEGEGLEVPPGAAHKILNLSAKPLEFLVTSQPPSHGDRIDLERPGVST